MNIHKKIFHLFFLTVFAISIFSPRLAIGAFSDNKIFQQEISQTIVVNSAQYISPIHKADETYSGISSKWSKDFSDSEVLVRYGNSQDDLGAWKKINPIEEDLPDRIGEWTNWELGEIILIRPSRYFQYSLISPSSNFGRNFSISFFLYRNEGTTVPGARILEDSSGLGPKIVSRSEWGANENYATWKPEYAEVKAIVIHHTGAEDKTQINQKEAVRNIYYGHAVTYGWGDIGYNYVIDVDGNIYEGRKGGNGAVAGHTLSYNEGTIGIVLIGNYSDRVTTLDQENALHELVAYLSYKNYIDPTGTITLKGKTIKTVVGHQDLNATSCPGSTLYARINDIRVKSDTVVDDYPEHTYGAEIVSVAENIKAFGGEEKEVQISVKNTGNSAWLSSGSQRVQVSGEGSLSSRLVSFGRSVEPGETASLALAIDVPFVNNSISQNFQLTQSGNNISGSSFGLSLSVTTPSFGAKIVNKSPDQNIRPGKQATVWLDIRNMGLETWQSSSGINLQTRDGGDSVFYTASDWGSKNSPGGLDSFNVKTGETVRLSFVVTAPSERGQYKEWFVVKPNTLGLAGTSDLEVSWLLVVGDQEGSLTGPEKKVYSQNLSDYKYSITDRSNIDQMLLPGETRTLFVELENTGSSNWYSDIVRLGTTSPQDRDSVFATGEWVGKNRIEPNWYKTATGEKTRFSFSIKAPEKTGFYRESFGVVADTIGWVNTQEIVWNITVAPPTYTAKLISQSPYIVTSEGLAASLSVSFVNTGNVAWQKNIVRLGGSGPTDRQSIFSDSSWKSSNRIEFSEEKVEPGETATFSVTLNTNQAEGSYKEYFRLVADGIAWFGEPGLFWSIKISKPFDDFEYLSQSSFVSIKTGETANVWLEVKNAGTTTWQKSGNTPIRLATTNPRDRNSVFLNTNRLSLVQNEVLPGQIGRFAFDIVAPNKPGEYSEYFGLVRDGVGWLKDIGIYWKVIVVQNTSPIATPSGSVQVSGSGPFLVADGSTEAILATGAGGDAVGISYSGGTYSFTLSGETKTSSSHLRIVPSGSNTILSVASYEDRPAWNTILNDNAFKGVIEVRYSPVHKKLWVINELFIEDYIQGVSEPLDSFDPEYLKVATIAERSYVYHHWLDGGRHPDDFITLKNSKKGNGDDQIYSGYNFSQRAPNIKAAAINTAGKIVTYGGQSVLTPYFSQSDGRTRSVNEVWGYSLSSYPWLVGKDDPYCAGLPLLGHGVGLSGKGARGLVSEGKTYSEVLAYYYTGTEVSSIDMSGVNVRVGIYSIDM